MRASMFSALEGEPVRYSDRQHLSLGPEMQELPFGAMDFPSERLRGRRPELVVGYDHDVLSSSDSMSIEDEKHILSSSALESGQPWGDLRKD